ncbi:Bifunctional DNA primase/polymerase, N-terminal [Klenkia marina]|uniref:Bifunctional DNA primase/polymerase, N-terminal n=1 Tax=Klenkia marina TaxID=1960309 RepID=A0A1G4X9T0_9ACTN|nr:bifunctional DNA primase/polymerase [Klenkia marina]SCX37986.1 Bifunctional DNA primase/polymerase, N-terminal [Klenkia marina]
MTAIANHAQQLAAAGWEIFPLRGKAPLFKTAHPQGDPLWGVCKGTCGRIGHGVLDATSDAETVRQWWRQNPTANIGGRVPKGVAVLDVDPRSGGADNMTALVREHGRLPSTLTVISGRGDGGRHFYLRCPDRPLSGAGLGSGLDLKTHAGYCVLPPSIHPDTGHPYRMQDGPRRPERMPDWLLTLLTPQAPPQRPPAKVVTIGAGPGIADRYSAEASWNDVLGAHGWRCAGGDGDSDGSRWLHPAATSSVSATVRHGLLFVYSPNTPLPVTESGNPVGLTRFRAYALLTHHGDMSAAAKTLLGRVAA